MLVLSDGSAVVAGETNSVDYVKGFPSSNTSIQFKGVTDIFVSKLAPNGRTLNSSIMFGGTGADTVFGISISAVQMKSASSVARPHKIFKCRKSPPIPAEQPDFSYPTDGIDCKITNRFEQ